MKLLHGRNPTRRNVNAICFLFQERAVVVKSERESQPFYVICNMRTIRR